MKNLILSLKSSIKDQIKFSLIAALIYLILTGVSITISSSTEILSPIWFANAIIIAMLLRAKQNYIIATTISIFITYSILYLYFRLPFAEVIFYFIANVSEIIICFELIKWHTALPFKITDISYGKQILISGLSGCIVAACIIMSYYYIYDYTYYFYLAKNQLISDIFCMLVIFPLFLSITADEISSLLKINELLRFVYILIFIFIFWLVFLLYTQIPLVLMMLPLIIYAYYYNLFRTSLCCFILISTFMLAKLLGILDASPIAHTFYSNEMIRLFIALTFLPSMIISLLMKSKNETLNILRESDDRFNSLLKYSSIGMSIVNADGKFIKVNKSLCEITGYTEQELIHLTFQDITYPDDLKTDVDLANKVMAKIIYSYTLEKRYIRKDKKIIWVLLSVSAVYDEHNEFKYFISQIENINIRKIAELEKNRVLNRLNLALKAGKIGIWEYDFASDYLIWDDEMFNIYDVEKKSFGHNKNAWAMCVHPDDILDISNQLEHSIKYNKILDTQFRIVTRNKEIRYIRVNANIVYDSEKNKEIMLGINWDATKQNEIVNELSSQKEKLHVTLQSIGDAVIVCDANGRVTFINKIAEKILNMTDHECINKMVTDIVNIKREDTQLAVPNPLIEAIKSRKIVQLSESSILVNNANKSFYIQDSAAPIILPNGEVYGSILIFQDITSKRLLEKQMNYQATHDYLTGLLNRNEFENNLIKHVNQNDPNRENNGYLCYMDLDKFKIINDVAGYVAGDNLLHEVSNLITQITKGSSLARLGGDEFGLLIYNSSEADAKILCQRIINAISKFRFVWDDNIYKIGISIGIVNIPSYSPSIVDLFSKADIACYTAKALGRNRFCFYSEKNKSIVNYNTELKMISEISRALEKDTFDIYAQKITNLTNSQDKNIRYELLLRIIGDDNNIKLPSEYIIAAERLNLISEVDKSIVKKILTHYDKQIAAMPNLYIAINLSVDSIRNSNFIIELIELINITKIDKSHINFEITETAAMSKLALTTRFINTVRSLGCTVSLDDFGSGISSYKYLKYCNVDFIKIDGDFIKSVDTNFKDYHIVQSINNIAHQFGAKTIAEHVDSDSVLKVLQAIGVDYVQGYLIHKPVPLTSILEDKSSKQ